MPGESQQIFWIKLACGLKALLLRDNRWTRIMSLYLNQSTLTLFQSRALMRKSALGATYFLRYGVLNAWMINLRMTHLLLWIRMNLKIEINQQRLAAPQPLTIIGLSFAMQIRDSANCQVACLWCKCRPAAPSRWPTSLLTSLVGEVMPPVKHLCDLNRSPPWRQWVRIQLNDGLIGIPAFFKK